VFVTEFENVCREPMPNKNTKVEDKNRSQIDNALIAPAQADACA
jgi:hypothetical protein